MWREFIKPYIQQVVDKTKELDMIFEMHTCGYVAPLLGELIEMGIEAIDPLQYCNNVPELKEKYGNRILFSGGFDSQGVLEMPGTSEEVIRAEVRKTLDLLAPGGNYSTLCPIIDKRIAGIVADEISIYGKNYYIK